MDVFTASFKMKIAIYSTATAPISQRNYSKQMLNYAVVSTLPAAALETITIAGRTTRPFSS